MRGADRKRGRDGDVGQPEARQRTLDEFAAGRGAGQRLVHVQVQHRAAGVFALQFVLPLQGLERVVGETHRQLRTVGVVGLLGRARLQDGGEALLVLLGEAVGGALGRRGLQVVEVTGFLLERHHAVAHVVEQPHHQRMAARVGDVVGVGAEVARHLVEAVHAQRAEVVAQRAQIAPGVRKQALVDEALDDLALDLQALLAQFQQFVQPRQQRRLVARVQVPQARAIDGDHAHRPGLLGRTEEAVAALEQFAQVQLQPAAHAAHHVRLQIRIDEILEVRQAITRRHLEQRLGIRARPVEVLGDVVGGDRKGEGAAARIAGHHHIDIGAVDEVHLGLQLAVAEGHVLPGDHRHLFAQVFRADPVEGEVGEGRLRAPARGHVEVVDQLLDALAHLLVAHAVLAHEGRQVGVEGAEGLRTGPLVLQRAEEVDDLADGAAQVLGRPGLDLAGHAVQALVQQRAQAPAGAIAAEHVEVVDVDVGLPVGLPGFGRVDVVEPVVGDDLTRDVEDEPTQRIALVGIGVDAPVALLQVFGDRRLDVDQRALGVAQLAVLFAVDRIGAQRATVAGGEQGGFHQVLHLLHVRRERWRAGVGDLRGQGGQHGLVRETPGFFVAELAAGVAGAAERRGDASGIEGAHAAVALDQVGGCRGRFDGHGSRAPDTRCSGRPRD